MWALVRRQHGVITYDQLRAFRYSKEAILHRLARRRLHVKYRAVYAVGRPELSRYGEWMAATLACGDDAALSESSAGSLWRFCKEDGLHVSAPGEHDRPGITTHQRKDLAVTRWRNIPVTTPIQTLLDLARSLDRDAMEAAISEADTLDLVRPDALKAAIVPGRAGARLLKEIFYKWDFVCTDSHLERRFLPISRRVGLPDPLTQRWLNGYLVDFWYPALKIAVETDGLAYHRNARQQTRRALSMQAHAAAGLTPLFFTRYQVVHEPQHVETILRRVASA